VQEQVPARDAQDVRRERLGVEARRRDPGRGQLPLGLAEEGA
jgi:hypothetical protein